jgi:hypothetical protein
MSDVLNLSLRKQPPRERPTRIRQDSKPGPDHEGEIGEDLNAVPVSKQDRAFQDAMQKALDRKQEVMPPAVEHRHDSVPMRRWVPGQVLTASNLEN